MIVDSSAESFEAEQPGPHTRMRAATAQNGSVRYPDASVLTRPLDVPAKVRAGMAAAMVAGAVIGGVILFTYFDAVVNAPAREQAALEENLSREVALDMPALASFCGLNDAEMLDALNASGATIYERTSPDESDTGGFEVIKLPDNVTLADAGVAYASGITNVSPSEAARLLNGSWDLTVNRESGIDVRIRYADFASGSIEMAIENALAAQGLNSSQIVDSGVDDAGNTYASGTTTDGATTYSWRVSVLPLSQVYEIAGVPETALYVGIRYTA